MRAIILALCLCSSFKIECSPHETHRSDSLISDSDFKSEKLTYVFSADRAAFKIAENYIGIAQSYFYDISSSNKSQTAAIYNKDSALQILTINHDIKSLSECSKASAHLISKTLTKLSIALNQLIIDSSINAPKSTLQRDYKNIQKVVASFEKKFPHTLGHYNKKNVCKLISRADKSLQAFVNYTEIYIRQLNELVFGSSSGDRPLVSSQDKLILNLREFIFESIVAVYLSTNKG